MTIRERPDAGTPRRGFTLIEVLLAVSLLALLAALLGTVLSNCRRGAFAAETTIDVLRKKVLIRESLQSELELSLSNFSFETSGDRVRGFSFVSYGRWSGRSLKVRSRYVFEPDPLRTSYRLIRYAVAEGIGVDETREILFEGVLEPALEAFSGAAREFVPVEKNPGIPGFIRLKFRLLRNPAESRKIPAPAAPGPVDDMEIILKNGFGA